MLINDYIASEIPTVKGLYSQARRQDQARFDRRIEAAQEQLRRPRPSEH